MSRDLRDEPIPFLDLRTPNRTLAGEILDAWREILEDAAFVGGPRLEGFERSFAAYQQTAHCVGVANGTEALRIALVAMGLKPGDEVITVPHTFIATTEAISQAGGRIVFVDVDPVTGTMDPGLLEAAITPRTRVVLPVHLYGQHADMAAIMEVARARGLLVLEDAAQAHGSELEGRRAGNHGAKAACFSFYPGKNLGACGEAGAVVTQDPKLAERMRVLRDHGQTRKYHHEVEGSNSRLDAIQAAVLQIKLRHLDDWNRQRREIASCYASGLSDAGVELPVEVPSRSHVYHLYVIRHPERDALRDYLSERGISTGLHYPIPLHLQPAYSHLGLAKGAFPKAERWAATCLSLPMFPGLGPSQIDRICDAVRTFTEKGVERG